MDQYAAGYTSSKGFDCTLNFMCLFSHLVVAQPATKHLDSEGVCRIFMDAVVAVYGRPDVVIGDAASIFTSEVTTRLMEAYGIDLRFSAAYHHETIGVLERFHSVLKKLLLAQRIEEGSDDWQDYLQPLVYAYNATVGRLGHSPFKIMFGRQAVLPLDAFTNDSALRTGDLPEYITNHLETLDVVWDATQQTLMRNSLINVKKVNLKRDAAEEFTVGDLVLVKKGTAADNMSTHPKATEVNDGPYEVTALLPGNNVRITDPKRRLRMRNEVACTRLTRYFDRATSEALELERQRCAPKLGRRYGVHSVVQHRVTRAADPHTGREAGEEAVEYRVRWAGFAGRDTWFTAPYLVDIWELVNAYRVKRNMPREDAPPRPPGGEPDSFMPAVDESTRLWNHFRPKVRERRAQARERARQEVRAQRGSRIADEPEPEREVTPAPTPEQPETIGSAPERQERPTFEERTAQREQARAAQRQQAMLRAEVAKARRGPVEDAAPPQSHDSEMRVAKDNEANERRTAAAAKAQQKRQEQREIGERRVASLRSKAKPMALMTVGAEGPPATVRMRAQNDEIIEVTGEMAILSGTIRDWLAASGDVEGQPIGEVVFKELEAAQLREAARYMQYKLDKKKATGAAQAFVIKHEDAIKLYRTACYLDL